MSVPKVTVPKVTIPKLRPFTIPWFKQYLFITGIIVVLLAGITVWFGIQARDYLLYPPTQILAVATDPSFYKDKRIGLEGRFLDFSLRQKPLCTPQGGTKQYPDLRKQYQTLPANFGLTDGNIDMAIKVMDADGKEDPIFPPHKTGDVLKVRGIIRTTTTLDYCNLDVAYQSAYLEVKPEELGLKDPTKK